MPQPLISQIPTRENFRANVFLVIREALLLLQKRSCLPVVEADSKRQSLNRELYACFREACHLNMLDFYCPVPEARNFPYKDDQYPIERENKIPDFQWHLIDSLADIDSCERHFALECKRLGKPSSPNWKLNENYVLNGICRFLTAPHEYGKGDDVCGMVGYVQNMSFDDILCEVNLAASVSPTTISPIPSPSDGWQQDSVTELEHALVRMFPISPFRMFHFWVDIRSSYK